ncbi:EAL domain-containing protein [Nocardioides anomalus]|uniref:EAL domain-containing protein n=1 Tax=Nocardioides anomalus TaxID=2712223 RepID=A0A6G6WDL6_9ACTN|nr:EAL domain-containing protein [Nocardioides anomalus]QIG43441.1 EAL domain-containing protein [Nocardioides anomalus]
MSEALATRGAVEVIVARQQVVDARQKVVGFELLYRSGASADSAGTETSGELMTVSVVLGALTFGVHELVGDKLLFCNVERGAIVGETPLTLPPARTVLEIREAVELDEELLAGVRARKQEGYTIALDGFSGRPEAAALLELADLVKVDLMSTDRDHAAALVEQCRERGVRAVAERCETRADVAWAREAGFELFQGYGVQRPEIVRGTTIAPSALAQVRLATELLDEDLSFDRIEAILRGEPGLVVQVLNLASAGAAHGLRRQVSSLREALVLMGTVRLRQWAALTILGRHGRLDGDSLLTGLVRARMCELLGQQRGFDRAEAFTAGLLSALDIVLGVDLAEVENQLELDGELAAAAFHGTTPLGVLVRQVSAYQEAVDEGRPPSGDLPNADMVSAMAFCWAMTYVGALNQDKALSA